jgi:MerR family transcriptional regulator, copper efflux regulator
VGDQELHQIGTVAERVGLSLPTIRHYEEVGLVIPSGRSAGGFRLYTDADIELLAQVKVMKPLKFTLDETRELLALRAAVAGGSATDEQLDAIGEFARRADERCVKLRRQLDEVEAYTAALHQDLGVRPR